MSEHQIEAHQIVAYQRALANLGAQIAQMAVEVEYWKAKAETLSKGQEEGDDS